MAGAAAGGNEREVAEETADHRSDEQLEADAADEKLPDASSEIIGEKVRPDDGGSGDIASGTAVAAAEKEKPLEQPAGDGSGGIASGTAAAAASRPEADAEIQDAAGAAIASGSPSESGPGLKRALSQSSLQVMQAKPKRKAGRI